MDYLTIIQETSKLYGLDVPTAFTDASTDEDYYPMMSEINNELKDLFLMKDFKFREKKTTFNTVIGQREYSHTYGVIHQNGLFVEGDTDPIEYKDDNTLYINDTTTGTPEYWKVFNNKIWLYPIPDAIKVMTVLYDTQYPATSSLGVEQAALTATGDLPNFPSVHHEVLVYGALVRLLKDDPTTQATYLGIYKQKLKQVTVESLGARDAAPRIIIGGNNSSLLDRAYYSLYKANG